MALRRVAVVIRPGILKIWKNFVKDLEKSRSCYCLCLEYFAYLWGEDGELAT